MEIKINISEKERGITYSIEKQTIITGSKIKKLIR